MNPVFRDAREEDLPAMVAMLEDDFLAKGREDRSIPLNPVYFDALKRIEAQPGARLIVAELNSSIVGMLQISVFPQFHYKGSFACDIESVRIANSMRGKGLGKMMMGWALEYARAEDCRTVQLTSNLKRSDAIHFYESLGFKHTHAGMKFTL